MAHKRMRNPIQVIAEVHFDGLPINIVDAQIIYNIACDECEVKERKVLHVLKNQEILNCVKDFVEEAVRQGDIHEQIPEEDSLIEYPVIPT